MTLGGKKVIYTLRRMQMPAREKRQGQRRRRRRKTSEEKGRRGKENDIDMVEKEIKREPGWLKNRRDKEKVQKIEGWTKQSKKARKGN